MWLLRAMKTQKSAVNRRARQNKTPGRPGGRSNLIPPFDSTITFGKKIRYLGASGITTVTIKDIDCFTSLLVASSSTAGRSIVSGVRVKSVEVWGPPPVAANSQTTVSVEFPPLSGAGPSGPSKVRSDTVLGSTFNAHVKAIPPKGSYASMWLGTTGASVMTLVLLEGAIVDVTFTYVLSNGASTYATQQTIAGATGGDLYELPLDFSSSGFLSPLSYASVAS
jgi:hypothetical protein